jgi:hypothetical protein
LAKNPFCFRVEKDIILKMSVDSGGGSTFEKAQGLRAFVLNPSWVPEAGIQSI